MSKIITTHLTVSAPVEHVWQTLTDLAGYRDWNPFFDGRHSFTLTPMTGGRTLVQQSETFTAC